MGFSSGVTETESPSAAFFNPAGLARLRRSSLEAGGFLAYPESEFHGQAYRAAASDPGDANYRIAGTGGGNPGRASPLPDIYYSRPEDGWTWAVGSSADGFNFRYERDWIGRYHGIETRLLLPNLHIAAGWALGEAAGIGIALTLQGLDARFTQDVDLGATIEREAQARCARQLGALACAPIVPQGRLGGRYDFHNILEARKLTPGWSAGLLLPLGKDAELGLSYRSAIRHALNGRADRRRFGPGHDGAPGWDGDELRSDPDLARLRLFLDGRAAATGAPGFEEEVVQPSLRNSSDAPFHARLVFPESISLGLRRRFGPDWLASVAAEWTRWGRLDQFTANFADRDVVTVELGLKDILRVGIGAEYRWRPQLRLRAGVAIEGGPDNPEMRHARAPDGERRYLNLGLGRALDAGRQLDLVASLLAFRGGPVRDVAVGSGNVLEGRIEDYWAVALGARLSW